MTTSIGDLVVAGDGALRGVWFDPHRGSSPIARGWRRDDDVFADVATQLGEWLDGRRRSFDLELVPEGTAFQRRVWDALAEIRYASTVTYADLAESVGCASARAVGHANARNPLSIVVPCHRVVGSGGSLTGYAGGVDRKRWLLDHERLVAGKVGDLSLRS